MQSMIYFLTPHFTAFTKPDVRHIMCTISNSHKTVNHAVTTPFYKSEDPEVWVG